MSKNDSYGSLKNLANIIDPEVFQRFDKLALLFVTRWPFSHIPDIYEVFGKELMIKFMSTFAGMTIKVPSREGLERAMRDHQIYYEIEERGAKPKALAKAMGIEVSNVYMIYHRMKKMFAELDEQRKKLMQQADSDE